MEVLTHWGPIIITKIKLLPMSIKRPKRPSFTEKRPNEDDIFFLL